MGVHQVQLFDFINFLNINKIRYVCIRGFLKLPVTADTDLDIVIHPDDFDFCLNNMKLKKKEKRESIKIMTQCIYEPCLTFGELDDSMTNGCFRVDLYNNFFYHCGKNKYQLPLFYLNVIFDCIKYNIPSTNAQLNIPKPEFEIGLLVCRAIIDKNAKIIQNKHINRIEHLIKNGIDNRILISLINSFCVTENSGILLKTLNSNYFKNYSIQEILNNKPREHLDEETLFKTKLTTSNLLVYQINKINEISTYVDVNECNEYEYMYNKRNKEHYWMFYPKIKFDNLIENYDDDKYENVDVCFCYLTNYKYVWYDALKMKYIPYLYINGHCKTLGEFDEPHKASEKYNIEAHKIFDYTYNKSRLIGRKHKIIQIRDGIHRCVINYNKIVNLNFVYNLSKRPKNIPFEHEFHCFILWKNNKILENTLLNIIENTEHIKLLENYTICISDKYKFVNNVYKKERKFYKFVANISKNDERISHIGDIRILIIKDFIPMYYDNVKQNKNIPINRKIKGIKELLRKEYSCYEFHSTDNSSEHNEVVNSISIDINNNDIKKYMN